MIAGTMRRLLRWTFNTLAAASLLLCLATAGLWVRSYWVYDEFYAHRWVASLVNDKYDYFIWSYRGHFAGNARWTAFLGLGQLSPVRSLKAISL